MQMQLRRARRKGGTRSSTRYQNTWPCRPDTLRLRRSSCHRLREKPIHLRISPACRQLAHLRQGICELLGAFPNHPPSLVLRRRTAGDQRRGGACRTGGRGCSVGLGGGLESSSHSGAHKSPSLYSPRVSTRASTSLGDKNPLPTGGTTRSPIMASASDNVCWIQLPSAPLAMFSFATIS